MTRDALLKLIDELDDVVVPIAGKVLDAVFAGKPWKAELSKAEREAISKYSQKRFDQALARGKGKPVPGTGE